MKYLLQRLTLVFFLFINVASGQEFHLNEAFNEDGTPAIEGYSLDSIIYSHGGNIYIEYDSSCVLSSICDYTYDNPNWYYCSDFRYSNEKLVFMGNEDLIFISWTLLW